MGEGKEGRGLGNMGSLSPRGIALQGGAHNLLAAKWRPGREGDRRGHSQGAFRDPQWALQGALEEESAGTPCAIGRRVDQGHCPRRGQVTSISPLDPHCLAG